MRTPTTQVAKHVGKQIEVDGFAETLRKQSKLIFIVLRDRDGHIQIVVSEKNKAAFEVAKDCSTESVLSIEGRVQERPDRKGQVEVHAEKIVVLSVADEQLPIHVVEKTGDETELQKRLDWRWLDIRKPKNTLIFKVWTTMEAAFREYWLENGYLQIYSPKFMSSPSESGAELFSVPYFDRTAYLAQSPQFFKQMAMASGLERVFETGPVFRANPSFTSRHDTEFTGYDAEMSYIKSHFDVMEEQSRLMQHVLKTIKAKHGKEIEELFGRKVVVPKVPFPKISFTEAKAALHKLGIPNDKVTDLSSEEEKALSEYFLKKGGHEFVYVTDYPFEGRAFYSMRHEDNDGLCKSFDLLWNGLEMSSGAQREHRFEQLLENTRIRGIKTEHMQSYLNFFKYGCPPHGGFGMSPSRLLMKVLNVGNVREVTYLYRGINRLDP